MFAGLIFLTLYWSCEQPRSKLTHILNGKILGDLLFASPFLRLFPWLVHCLPALLYQTRLCHGLPTNTDARTQARTVLYAGTHANVTQTSCLAFPRPAPTPHLSPQAPFSFSACVSGQSLRDCSLTSLHVCCSDGWGAGTWVQEISTSQIRLINPQLKLLAKESCWIKNQISPGACR